MDEKSSTNNNNNNHDDHNTNNNNNNNNNENTHSIPTPSSSSDQVPLISSPQLRDSQDMSYPPPLPDHFSSNNTQKPDSDRGWNENSLEMHQRHSQQNGFTRLDSTNTTPEPGNHNNGYYNNYNNMHNSGTPPPGQPYPYPPPPPGGQPPYYTSGGYGVQQPPVPFIPPEEQNARLPYGYNRHPLKRLLLGPIRVPIFSYTSALVMLGVLIYEFVKMNQLTGRVIETNPFNPMIGPSSMVLINEGARFTPCIREVPSFPTTEMISYCYQSASDTCTLEQLCGFGGFGPDGEPHQSFRLVLPIFMHAGVIHFLMNMLTHLRLGVDLERALGTPRYVFLYMAAGIWGFVLSAMLSQNLSASMGCSGALFGLIGYMFVDVLINWKFLPHPVRDLMSLLISTIISLVLGLLPGLDNFAHIGGFVVGLVMGIAIAPMRPLATRKIKIITWIARLVALIILVVLFVVTIKEFYSATDPSKICPNCKYLSCLPVNGWCDL